LGTSAAHTPLVADPVLRECYERGKARAEHELYMLIVDAARNGDRLNMPAVYALNNRHGWRTEQTDARVAVSITLPAPMTPDEYMRTLRVVCDTHAQTTPPERCCDEPPCPGHRGGHRTRRFSSGCWRSRSSTSPGPGAVSDVGARSCWHGVDMYGAALMRSTSVRQTRAARLRGRCRNLFGAIYRGAARYNATDGIWRFPIMRRFCLTHLLERKDYDAHQGPRTADHRGGAAVRGQCCSTCCDRTCGRTPLRMIWIANPVEQATGGAAPVRRQRKEWVPYVEEQTDRATVTVSALSRQPASSAEYARNISAVPRSRVAPRVAHRRLQHRPRRCSVRC
jgi:hypothetical protein